MALAVVALSLLLTAATQAAETAAGVGEAAVARALKAPPSARFRGVSVHGDIVCGEIGAPDPTYTPFYAYRKDADWSVHTAADGRGLKLGLQCFDEETTAGRKLARCVGYDFAFYFAYDHFCR